MLAHWMLFLARPLIEDTPLPWQKPQTRLTPQRVRQSLKPIFALIGSPACLPKPRGPPAGAQADPERQKHAIRTSEKAL